MTHESMRPGLIETMRLSSGRIALVDGHMGRLARSARHFGYRFDESEVRAALEGEVSRLSTAMEFRIRLMLRATGRMTLEAALWSEPVAPLRLGMHSTAVDSADELFYHKTTSRGLYEEAYVAAREAGLDEVLFVNERGEVTEGSRHNLFIRRDRTLLTPPVSCGLLGGVYRRHVLDSRTMAVETVLYPADLDQCDELFLCNAVVGLVPAFYTGRLVRTHKRASVKGDS